MGKAITYLSILIFIDLLFIITGQICTGADSCTISSLIFDTLLNLGKVSGSQLMFAFIGDLYNLLSSNTGIFSIIAGIGMATLGSVITKSDSLLFLAVAGAALSILVNDFVQIYLYLASLSPIFSVLIMGPIIILFIFTIVDRSRGKD